MHTYTLACMHVHIQESAVVAVMDKDCASLSKREDILRDLVAKGLQIDPWGSCLSGFKVSKGAHVW